MPLLLALLAVLPCSVQSVLRAAPSRHGTNLLEKGQRKWNWKSASEESKTEWAIVLKRYVMFDMTLLELEHHWDEALPSLTVGTSSEEQKVDDESLAGIQAKVAKLQDNMQKAVLNQNTSDSTAEDMQRDLATNHLTKAEKKRLREEHERERYGFFAVEASAQDVFSKASALVQEIRKRNAKPSQSWASIVPVAKPAPTAYPSLLTNVTAVQSASSKGGAGSHANQTTSAAVDPITAMLQKYREVVKTFRTDLGNFQNMQQKASTNLLAIA